MAEKPYFGNRVETKEPMQDIMLDLESFGSDSNSVIISVGAVYFDPVTGKLGDEFYQVITDPQEQVRKMGRTINADTMLWWMQQDGAARFEITNPTSSTGRGTYTVLSDFATFIQDSGVATPRSSARIWGNGSDFDNVLLANLYKGAGMRLPWSFRNNMCYRTLKSQAKARGFKNWRENSQQHNALADAKFQAGLAHEFYGHLGWTT